MKTHFKEGQRVWAPAHGWGTVKSIDSSVYPVKVKFDERTTSESYTYDGRSHSFERPTLFTEEVKMPVNKFDKSTFEVGDWVVIVDSGINFPEEMKPFVNRVVKIIQVNSTLRETTIRFKNDGSWFWCFEQGHFRLATPEEIPV